MARSGRGVALITGGNSGIGKEVARQLALTGSYEMIYLACRDRMKAVRAQADLEKSTGKMVFEVLEMDLSDSSSVRKGASSLPQAIDDVVMNAGGVGGKAPFSLTRDGVTHIFAANVLGHATLFDALVRSGKLKQSVVFAGSEAARGVPIMGMRAPKLATSSADDFASLCDGSYFRHRNPDPIKAYAQVKYVGAMWIASVARRHPHLQMVTISPGNTKGTGVTTDFPHSVRYLMRYLFNPLIAPIFGMVHDVQEGAARLVRGLSGDGFKSGHFYGSRRNALTGALVDQGEIFSDLMNETFQDNASSAVYRFI